MISYYDYKSARIGSEIVCLIALVCCAFTGSWVAAFLAVAFGVVDTSVTRALEIWQHKPTSGGRP